MKWIETNELISSLLNQRDAVYLRTNQHIAFPCKSAMCGFFLCCMCCLLNRFNLVSIEESNTLAFHRAQSSGFVQSPRGCFPWEPHAGRISLPAWCRSKDSLSRNIKQRHRGNSRKKTRQLPKIFFSLYKIFWKSCNPEAFYKTGYPFWKVYSHPLQHSSVSWSRSCLHVFQDFISAI